MPHIERQPILFGRSTIGWGEIDKLRLNPGLLAKRPQPNRPVGFVVGQQHLVEDHQHGFVFLGRLAEELFDRRIVVFLLSQHRDQHIGTAANVVGSFPVHADITVDVGRVEDQ